MCLEESPIDAEQLPTSQHHDAATKGNFHWVPMVRWRKKICSGGAVLIYEF